MVKLPFDLYFLDEYREPHCSYIEVFHILMIFIILNDRHHLIVSQYNKNKTLQTSG